jgi:hypothetical protein
VGAWQVAGMAAPGSKGAAEAALAFLVQHCQVRAGLRALGGTSMHAQDFWTL